MRTKQHVKRTQVGSPPLHISVGSAPVASIEAGVRKDLALVKAALLYADRVTLRSPNSAMLQAVASLNSPSLEEQVQLVVELAPVLDTSGGQQLANEMHNLLMRASNRESKRKLANRIRPAFKEIRVEARKLLRRFGAEELIRATQLDLLEVQAIDMGRGGALAASVRQTLGARDDSEPDVALQYVEGVLEDIRNPGTFPMLDVQTNQLVSAGVQEGVFSFTETEERWGQHVALAGHVFDRLPVFELASIDELLGIRKDLRAPLVRFRSAMIRFGTAIKQAPWNEDFRNEAELILLQNVEPALLELHEAVQENSSLRHFIDAVVDGWKMLGALGLALAGGEQLIGDFAGITPIQVGSLFVAQAAWKAEQKRRQLDNQVKNHDLYFVYRLHRYGK